MNWIVEEVQGIWWAYKPPRPEQFVTHTTRPNNLFGPYYSKQYAEEQVAKMTGGKSK